MRSKVISVYKDYVECRTIINGEDVIVEIPIGYFKGNTINIGDVFIIEEIGYFKDALNRLREFFW